MPPRTEVFGRMIGRVAAPVVAGIYAHAFNRGYSIATSRAESRQRIGWPLERMSGEGIMPIERGETRDPEDDDAE